MAWTSDVYLGSTEVLLQMSGDVLGCLMQLTDFILLASDRASHISGLALGHPALLETHVEKAADASHLGDMEVLKLFRFSDRRHGSLLKFPEECEVPCLGHGSR